MKANKLNMAGPLFAIYLKWDFVKMSSVMDIGVAIDKAVAKGQGRVRYELIAAQLVMIAHYFGPYDNMKKAYWVLDQSIKESGKKIAGSPWEVYIGDPGVEKDPAKLQTDILFPVK